MRRSKQKKAARKYKVGQKQTKKSSPGSHLNDSNFWMILLTAGLLIAAAIGVWIAGKQLEISSGQLKQIPQRRPILEIQAKPTSALTFKGGAKLSLKFDVANKGTLAAKSAFMSTSIYLDGENRQRRNPLLDQNLACERAQKAASSSSNLGFFIGVGGTAQRPPIDMSISAKEVEKGTKKHIPRFNWQTLSLISQSSISPYVVGCIVYQFENAEGWRKSVFVGEIVQIDDDGKVISIDPSEGVIEMNDLRVNVTINHLD